jgi:isopenicillin-N N-acyltransferase-like protein
MAALLELPLIHARGGPSELGRAQGEQLAEPIRAFVAQRLRAARVYLRERGGRDDQAFVALGRRCLAALESWDAAGWSEHQAVAAAAGVDAGELYTCANMTDIRDILLLADARAEAEGCSMVLLPPAASASRQLIAAQTWDLNPGDLEFVVAVHRLPDAAPETWSISCAGCPSLIGMNQHGVAVGTTNLKTRGARVGVPYLSLLHRALACRTRTEAGGVFSDSPRAAAHSFWAADATGAEDWECTATSAVRRVAEQPLVRTNHCLVAAHQEREGEAPSSSSRARLLRLEAFAAGGGHDEAGLRTLFSSRADGVDSINRYPEDAQGTSTNACVIALPAARRLTACRGPADRGRWTTLPFERA